MSGAHQKTGFRFLDAVERIGNKLPDPVTLFVIGALLVLLASSIAAAGGWSREHPATHETVAAKSLLTREGVQWIWLNMVRNFTGFAPLGIVLTAMLGIGVAEKSGLIAACLKGMVQITPRSLLTPAVIFVGVNSSIATDAGYVVLPPLAALVFAKAGRSPLVGLAAVIAGVGGGFSANILLTGLDPLLQGLTETGARLLDSERHVRADCNYYFMIASTFVITFVGWGITHWIVEPRFSKADIAEQIASANLPGLAAGEGNSGDDRLTASEKRGLFWAMIAALITGAGVAALILIPGAPLHGSYAKPPSGKQALIWPDVIVPLLFVVFLLPGIAYGLATRVIRNDRDVAKMMADAMSAMGMYVVLAFFAAQFVEWFRESNLGFLLALEGAEFLQELNAPVWVMLAGIIVISAFLDLFIGSASAKWAFMAPVFVPMFMAVGISPELTQAAYRVGDSCVNPIAPMNPYVVVMLVFMQRFMPKAGLGSLIALLLPYSLVFLVTWTALLLAWVALGLPLGPGHEALFIK
ncbi:MAG TPA: AbgT family transporter [Phycisphaerales bacterium]|nr:AbgT family transporter [Phycisphaerales bacterium]